MDVVQILVLLGTIGWGLFQVRTQKQKKTRREKIVRQAPSEASFSVEEDVSEEMISVPIPETGKKRRYAPVKPSISEERVLNVPEKRDQKPGMAFRNAADARTAFIGSEIFRRKYD